MKGFVNKSFVFIAFGAGSALALCLPTIWTTRVLALALVAVGVMCCQKPKKPHC